MAAPPSTRNQAFRQLWVLAIVVLASSGLTIFATYFAHRTVSLQAHERFKAAAAEAHATVQMRMESYLALLQGGVALLTAEPELTRLQFRRYVERLRIFERYSGIRGIGFSARVPQGQEEQLVATARQEGHADFQIWPRSVEEVHTILYLEPEDQRNLAALGYNMFSEPVRRQAMRQACDSGAPVASSRIRLVQEIEEPAQSGFLIYLPVYAGQAIPATVAERRASLRGFIYAPFRADDLFKSVFEGKSFDSLKIEIHDGAGINSTNLLYRSTGGRDSSWGLSDPMKTSLSLETASRTWTLRFSWTRGPAATSFLAPSIFAVGGILTFLLAMLIRSEAAARRSAEDINDQLRLSEQSLLEARGRLEHHALELEQRVAERTALLQESVSDLEAILYHVAHDLRAPVRAMGSFATILEDEHTDQLDIQAREHLRRIAEAASRMDRLVSDLLAFGRLAQAAMPVDTVLLDAPLKEALKRKSAQIEAQSARIQVEQPLPAVKANAPALVEILSQLIDNCLKFASPDTPPCVRIWASSSLTVRLHIQDNGIGVKPQYHERIFRVFEKLHPHGIYPGTGIGLAIVRKAVERMGGRVGVDSGPGQGSTFWIELPLAHA